MSKESVDMSTETMERKPRIVLREKKRGSAARVALKEQWRSSTTLLDSIYQDVSKTIPSVEARCHRQYVTRSSLFHTPSTASEELDDNVLINGDL
ncbi:hypothetical protein TELCIR_17102, partial [Teladorsagia circumcincta]